MTKNQITAILTKYASIPNQAGTKKFIPADKISEIAGEIMKLNKGSFIPPTLEESKEFAKSKGYIEDCGAKAWEYYEAMEWKDNNGKPVRSWKGKYIAVWFKPEYKIKEQPKSHLQEGMVL